MTLAKRRCAPAGGMGSGQFAKMPATPIVSPIKAAFQMIHGFT
jgi:hypothetical protein